MHQVIMRISYELLLCESLWTDLSEIIIQKQIFI